MTEQHGEITPELSEADLSLFVEERDDLVASDNHPPEVTFSTQDYPVDGLVKRLRQGTMRIPQFGTDDPRNQVDGFQRGFVWSKAQMDRFIESLLLGYPIPGVFMVKQADNSMLVLDGQQRLETLRRFYTGMHNDRAFKLDNVSEDFKGLTYETLGEELQLKLDDSFIHATIVTTDGSGEVNDAIYGIFERLNSGGTQLTPHEIRIALFAGPLMVLVETLNSDQNWRALYGPPNKRIRDHELVLRILALFLRADDYVRPLKRFLNDFSGIFRDSKELPNSAENLFTAAAEAIATSAGKTAFRRPGGTQVNTAQAEAIMVATMRHLKEDNLVSDIPAAIDKLLYNDVFILATTQATADNESVRVRLREATKALGRL